MKQNCQFWLSVNGPRQIQVLSSRELIYYTYQVSEEVKKKLVTISIIHVDRKMGRQVALFKWRDFRLVTFMTYMQKQERNL